MWNRFVLWFHNRNKSQGLCDTTLTERFQNKNCVCSTYEANLGPCATFEAGSTNRCVYCDHEWACHHAIPNGGVVKHRSSYDSEPL